MFNLWTTHYKKRGLVGPRLAESLGNSIMPACIAIKKKATVQSYVQDSNNLAVMGLEQPNFLLLVKCFIQ